MNDGSWIVNDVWKTRFSLKKFKQLYGYEPPENVWSSMFRGDLLKDGFKVCLYPRLSASLFFFIYFFRREIEDHLGLEPGFVPHYDMRGLGVPEGGIRRHPRPRRSPSRLVENPVLVSTRVMLVYPSFLPFRSSPESPSKTTVRPFHYHGWHGWPVLSASRYLSSPTSGD
ncbi:hypothetical protein BYT27DRAFT_6433630 [Phlegmacium glaucopus]|nr:hypothetical protein BYT27DRAFT_6433630 [Phlegmacium glaucopus]